MFFQLCWLPWAMLSCHKYRFNFVDFKPGLKQKVWSFLELSIVFLSLSCIHWSMHSLIFARSLWRGVTWVTNNYIICHCQISNIMSRLSQISLYTLCLLFEFNCYIAFLLVVYLNTCAYFPCYSIFMFCYHVFGE